MQSSGFPSRGFRAELTLLFDWEKWCLDKGTSPGTCEAYRRYLEKPLNPKNRWSAKAYKLYLKWLCDEKGDEQACLQYKKLKVPQASTDLKVPSQEEIKRTLELAGPYRQVYEVLLQSGLRLVEALKLLREADKLQCVELDGFYRCMIGWKRGTKKALWAYLLKVPDKPQHITRYMVENHAKKHSLVMPKYIRKFVATKMSELDIPDDVIDFIEGRTPEKVLGKSYAKKLGKADKHYPRYAEWLRENGFLSEDRGG